MGIYGTGWQEKESRSQPDQQGSAVQDKVRIKSKQQNKRREKYQLDLPVIRDLNEKDLSF